MKIKLCLIFIYIQINCLNTFCAEVDADIVILNQQQQDGELYFVDGSLEVSIDLDSYFLNLKMSGRVDPFVETRNFSAIQDMYIKKEFRKLSLSLGQKVFNSKVFEGPDQIDIINPIIIDSSLVDPVKIGVPFTQIQYSLERHTFSFNYLPYFVSNDLPFEDSSINIPNNIKEKIITKNLDDSGRAVNQYFVEFSSYWSLFDTKVSYLKHISTKVPQLELGKSQEINLNYLEVENVSLSLIKAFSSWVFKAFIISNSYTNQAYDVFDHTILGVGYEAPFYLKHNLETSLYLEYTYIEPSKSGVESSLLNVNQNDIFMGIRQSFDSLSNPELKLGISFDTEFIDEHFFSVQYEQNLSLNTRLELELASINQDSSRPTNILNINSLVPYADADYLRLGLRIYL